MYSFIAIGSAVLPVIILLVYVYQRDHFEKEPIWLLALTFIGGMASVFFDLMIRDFFPSSIEGPHYLQALYDAGVQAGLCEEFSKFFFLFFITWWNRNFNEYFDGIVYAVFVSLGFAMVENIQYVMLYGTQVLISRAALAVPGHFLDAVAMGYFYSLAKFFPKKRLQYFILTLLVPILLHTIYDFLLVVQSSDMSDVVLIFINIAFYAFDILVWVYCIKKIKKITALYE